GRSECPVDRRRHDGAPRPLRRPVRRQDGERARPSTAGRSAAAGGLNEDAMELPILTRLKKELAQLRNELTFELPKALQEAAAHRDLSETAEYEAAKHRQDFVRSRIVQIEGRIRELSMYNVSSIPHGVVAYGSRVTLEDDDGGSTCYDIVFPEEVDAAKGQIS